MTHSEEDDYDHEEEDTTVMFESFLYKEVTIESVLTPATLDIQVPI